MIWSEKLCWSDPWAGGKSKYHLSSDHRKRRPTGENKHVERKTKQEKSFSSLAAIETSHWCLSSVVSMQCREVSHRYSMSDTAKSLSTGKGQRKWSSCLFLSVSLSVSLFHFSPRHILFFFHFKFLIKFS